MSALPAFDLEKSKGLHTSQTHRAAGRTPAVFRFARDGESKNPRSDEITGLLCRGKVLSFAYFSLHEQRKAGRASARNGLFRTAERKAEGAKGIAKEPSPKAASSMSISFFIP
ncbi:MAG: hypothetical protein KA144_03135 [Xanthomonadaceae bacterium]|nr:hypothetical protein [Xanthomonadaceae bacterium]